MSQAVSIYTLEGTSTHPHVVLALLRNKHVQTMLYLVAFLGMIEWGARQWDTVAVDLEPPLPEIFQTDPEVGTTLIPGVTHVGVANRFTINRWGFRGAEVPETKPHGTIRIAALGDSTTAALVGIDDDSVWVARMADDLNNEGRSNRYDTINAAVPGMELGPAATFLEKRVGRFKPDVVVVLAVANDLWHDGSRQFGHAAPAPKTNSSMHGFLVDHSAIARRIARLNYPIRRQWFPWLCHDRLDDQGIVRYHDHLEKMRTLCRLRHWKLVLCTAPSFFGSGGSGSDQWAQAARMMAADYGLSLRGAKLAFERYNDTIRRYASEHEITLVDLARTVPRREVFFQDMCHFSDRGHKIVARTVADAVLAMVPVEPHAEGAG